MKRHTKRVDGFVVRAREIFYVEYARLRDEGMRQRDAVEVLAKKCGLEFAACLNYVDLKNGNFPRTKPAVIIISTFRPDKFSVIVPKKVIRALQAPVAVKTDVAAEPVTLEMVAKKLVDIESKMVTKAEIPSVLSEAWDEHVKRVNRELQGK